MEQRDRLIAVSQSSEEVKAKPASLYRVWQEGLKQWGVSHPYDKSTYAELARRYSLEGFKQAAALLLSKRNAPPASVRIMLK